MICPGCGGEGAIEVSVASQCTRRIGECCGGCTVDEPCKRCGGSGQVPAGTCTSCGAVVPADTLEPDGTCPACIEPLAALGPAAVA